MSLFSSDLEIDVADQQERHAIKQQPLVDVTRRILADAGVQRGTVSLAIIDDPQMHELNRRHLNHDYPTDVLSFLLDRQGDAIEAEVIVSADTAAERAAGLQCSTQDELMLYVVHGVLHLIGYEDGSPEQKETMRAAEQQYLKTLGVEPRYDV